jgi:hypothetical protein
MLNFQVNRVRTGHLGDPCSRSTDFSPIFSISLSRCPGDTRCRAPTEFSLGVSYLVSLFLQRLTLIRHVWPRGTKLLETFRLSEAYTQLAVTRIGDEMAKNVVFVHGYSGIFSTFGNENPHHHDSSFMRVKA